MFKQELSVTLDSDQLLFPLSDALLDGRHRWDAKRHCHAEFELHLILDGSCSVHVESQQYSLQPGTALLIAPGQYHHPLQVSEDFRRLCLSFSVSQGALSQALIHTATPCKVFSMDFQECAAGILRELSASSPFRSTLLHGYLEQISVFLLRALKIAPLSSSVPPESDWRTGVIDEYFEAHITDGSEAELAQLLHLSTRQLSGCCSKTTA